MRFDKVIRKIIWCGKCAPKDVKFEGPKCGTGKCGTENAGREIAGPGKCGTWNKNNEFHIYACVTDISATCGVSGAINIKHFTETVTLPITDCQLFMSRCLIHMNNTERPWLLHCIT